MDGTVSDKKSQMRLRVSTDSKYRCLLGTRAQAVCVVKKDGTTHVSERQAWSSQGDNEPEWNGTIVSESFRLDPRVFQA